MCKDTYTCDKLEIWAEVAVHDSNGVAGWKRESKCASTTKVRKPGSTCDRSRVQTRITIAGIEAADCISAWNEEEGHGRDIAEAVGKGCTCASGDCDL